MLRWRGRDSRPREQVANAWDSAVDLTPASEAAAAAAKSAWAALLPGQTIPLIGEDSYDEVNKDDPDEFWSR
jgi:hypothetical protein